MSLTALHPERVRSLVAISAPPRPFSEPGKLKALVTALRVVGPIAPLRSAVAGAQLTDEHRRDPPLPRRPSTARCGG